MATKYFLQRLRKGRVRNYVHKHYGRKAFTKKGTIKVQYLNLAKARAKREHNKSLESAIVLAKRLKKGFRK